MSSHLEVIDAFVDGERVDASVLKDALADPAGRDYFVDAWLLREAVRHDRDLPAVERTPPRSRWMQRAAGGWLVAASLAIGAAGGYLAGYQRPRPVTSAPPIASAPPAATTPAASRAVFPAPPPTRVIQLEFQPDARRSGGD